VSRVGYHESARELTAGDVGNAAGRACVVLYQTPILHVSKNARVGVTRTHEFYVASLLLCRYFRLDHGTVGKQGLKGAYELFNAPKSG